MSDIKKPGPVKRYSANYIRSVIETEGITHAFLHSLKPEYLPFHLRVLAQRFRNTYQLLIADVGKELIDLERTEK